MVTEKDDAKGVVQAVEETQDGAENCATEKFDNDSWPYESFTKKEAEQWKSIYGVIECKEINGIEYVYRGLRRGEHNTLVPDDFEESREIEEERTCAHAIISPQMTEQKMSDCPSGIATNLFIDITRISNFLPNNLAYMQGEFFKFPSKSAEERVKYAERQLEKKWPTMFPGLKLPTLDDLQKWIGRGMPMSWSKIEDILVIQVAQSRRQFKRYREKLAKESATQSRGQEILAEETTVFPYAKDFDCSSDQFLSGTVKQISDRALLIAEFESESAPVKL